MIWVPKRIMELPVTVDQGFSDRVEIEAWKDGRKIGTWDAKNIITDTGLEWLKSQSLNNILEGVTIASKKITARHPMNVVDLNATYNPSFWAQGVHEQSCGAGMVGSADNSQESWIETWSTNRPVGDTTAGDPAYQWREVTRTWRIDDDSFNPDLKRSDMSGFVLFPVDAGSNEGDWTAFNGASRTELTHFFIGQPAALVDQAHADECLALTSGEPPVPIVPTPSPHMRVYHIHAAPLFIWSQARFKDQFGSPIEISIDPGVQFAFKYTLRAQVPTADVVSVVNVKGTDYTLTTRAQGANQDALWGALTTGQWAGGSGLSLAWESNTMPAINGVMVNGGKLYDYASSGVLAAAPGVGQRYREVEYGWQPSLGNFPLGIGAITHGAHPGTGGSDFSVVTGISPRLPKTNQQILTMQARYSWSRVGGD